MEPIAEAESQYEQSVMSTSVYRDSQRQDLKTSRMFVMDAEEYDMYSLDDEDGSDDEQMQRFGSMNDMPLG